MRLNKKGCEDMKLIGIFMIILVLVIFVRYGIEYIKITKSQYVKSSNKQQFVKNNRELFGTNDRECVNFNKDIYTVSPEDIGL